MLIEKISKDILTKLNYATIFLKLSQIKNLIIKNRKKSLIKLATTEIKEEYKYLLIYIFYSSSTFK